MTFRIDTAAPGRFTIFILSGRIEKQAVTELRRLLNTERAYREIVLNLENVSVVDPDASTVSCVVKRMA